MSSYYLYSECGQWKKTYASLTGYSCLEGAEGQKEKLSKTSLWTSEILKKPLAEVLSLQKSSLSCESANSSEKWFY